MKYSVDIATTVWDFLPNLQILSFDAPSNAECHSRLLCSWLDSVLTFEPVRRLSIP